MISEFVQCDLALQTYICICNDITLWLGNDRETSSYTTAIAK
jgi:hypothetical protein